MDCGKDLYFGYSNAPNYLKMRLRRLKGTLKRHPYAQHKDGVYDDMEVIDPGKQQGVEDG